MEAAPTYAEVPLTNATMAASAAIFQPWVVILAGGALLIVFVLLAESHVPVILQAFGVRGLSFGLRVRSSAYFPWLLQLFDFFIVWFFSVILLVVASLAARFDGRHQSWGLLVFLADQRAPVFSACLCILGVRFYLLRQCPPSDDDGDDDDGGGDHNNNDDDAQAPASAPALAPAPAGDDGADDGDAPAQAAPAPGPAPAPARCRSSRGSSLDFGLLALIAMILVGAFPWPEAMVSPDVMPDPLLVLLLWLVVLLLWLVVLFQTWQQRNHLRLTVDSISTVAVSRLTGQQPLSTAGDFVEVGQKLLAGFDSDNSLLYVRPEAATLWEALQRASKLNRNLSVGGPPGTGKSTEVWAWALWTAANVHSTVVWYHCTKMRVIKAVIDGEARLITKHKLRIDRLYDDIESSGGNVVVVDGVTTARSTAISSACSDWCTSCLHRRRFVLVSSMSIVVAAQELKEAKVDDVVVPSWTLAQYKAACKSNSFYRSIARNLVCPLSPQPAAAPAAAAPAVPAAPAAPAEAMRNEMLEAKYYYAGGCARWMFEFDYRTFHRDFKAHKDKVSDFTAVFNEAVGTASPDAVNHLRSVHLVDGGDDDDDGGGGGGGGGGGRVVEKVSFFISQYAAAQFASQSDRARFLKESYAQATAASNRSYRGWIYELDVDHQLTTALKSRQAFRHLGPVEAGPAPPAYSWVVGHYITFKQPEDLRTKVLQLLPVQNASPRGLVWARPTKFNNKAYDFLCFWRENGRLNMVAANTTCGVRHAVKLHALNALARFLGTHVDCVIASIRFDFLVPPTVAFRVGVVEGALAEWTNFRQAQWPNNHNADTLVDGGFIAVINVAEAT
jgi:hypothetical protein